jgi:hypothetical protein
MAVLAMEIEFYGGPADGMLLAVPSDTETWVMPSPAMTPAEFIALESGAPYPSKLPIIEHSYRLTHYFGRQSGKRVFTYTGSRRAR